MNSEYAVSKSTINGWIKKTKPISVDKDTTITAVEYKNLLKKNARLEEEIEILKKAIDFLSMSGHKIYGPKGVGVAYVGPDKLGLRHRLPSLLDGGGQEY